MNRVVVTRAAAGLAAYLRDQGAVARRVGRDRVRRAPQLRRLRARHRRGDDRRRASARCVLPRPLPTPLLAFAIRELGCVAGVMVTASHNPPRDNGYKVYLGDGSQIVPPADAEIAARIDAVGALADVPRGDGWTVLGDDIVDAYLDTVAGLAGDGPRDLRLVYTPLHGVGGTSVVAGARDGRLRRAVRRRAAGAARPRLPDRGVPQPGGAGRHGPRDGAGRRASTSTSSSPTTRTPTGAPPPCPTPHGWRMLRGDEVGALLAHHLLHRRPCRHLRVLDRLLEPARQDGGRGRPAVRRDADRLQVDQQGRRASCSATRRRSATASTPST